ncbi:hypothetical protein DL96DRAFT_91176 [Flagelloscypha sp. PMI_526]|nr:hypothetical protein DL96DRAFT_91176 [Flagelloscypha sp. PMI_526]
MHVRNTPPPPDSFLPRASYSSEGMSLTVQEDSDMYVCFSLSHTRRFSFTRRVHKYLSLLGLTILYWDHLLTLDDEIKHFWRKPKISNIAFFVNRYLAFFANIPLWVVNFLYLDQYQCSKFLKFHQFFIVVTQVVVGVLLAIRVWALYAQSAKVKYYMILLFVVLAGVAVFAVVTGHATYDSFDCSQSLSRRSAVRVVIAWEALFFFDLNIFILTLLRSRWASRTQIGKELKIPLVEIIARDGALYFAALLLANLANIITFYLARPRLTGALSTFASSVSVSMMSRLMINLHNNSSNILEPTSQHLHVTTQMDFRARSELTYASTSGP